MTRSDVEKALPFIEEALEHGGGTHTLGDVLQGVVAGDFQMWTAEGAACVTEIIQHPRKRVLAFWLAGGDLQVLMTDIEPRARAWGEAQGCDLFLGFAADRPGWARALQQYGYRPGWRVFRRAA